MVWFGWFGWFGCGCLVDWLVGWFVTRLVGWLVIDEMVCCLVCWMLGLLRVTFDLKWWEGHDDVVLSS